MDANILCDMIHVRDKALCISFGNKIKAIREAKSLSQEALANEADISLSQVSRIERGILNPTLSTIYTLAKALNTNPGN